MLEITRCYVILHLNLKRLGFTGEPMTQWTHQSCVNVKVRLEYRSRSIDQS